MISVIVPLSESRREFFEQYCRPSIHADSFELIVIDQPGHACRKRNLGASQARGEFLFFLDDDTILALDCLTKLLAAITDHAVAYCDFDGIVWPGVDRKPFRHRAPRWTLERFRKGPGISTMSLIRADAFPGWDESLARYQDWDLFWTIAETGATGVRVPEILFTACYLDQGISAKGKAEELRQIVREKHRL